MSAIGPPSPQQYARDLLSEHDPRRWRDSWLEITACAAILLLIACVALRLSRSKGVVVVCRDTPRGSQTTPDRVAVSRQLRDEPTVQPRDREDRDEASSRVD